MGQKRWTQLQAGDVIRHPDTNDWEVVERQPNACAVEYSDCPEGCVEYSAEGSALIEHQPGSGLVEVHDDPASVREEALVHYRGL